MSLTQILREKCKQKPLLLMTHIVLGDPSFEASEATVEAMVRAGVDLMELQIPFSDPMADGPVILQANARALEHGARVEQAFAFARKITARYDIPFLFMTYYNILHRYRGGQGVQAFVADMAQAGVQGAIVPDLPLEEAGEYLVAMMAHQRDPIFIFSPQTSETRMRRIAEHARGLIYCVARKGVTGESTQFSAELDAYLARCRRATDLPLALGFGVKSREDIEYLRSKVDIAVVGSETIRVIEQRGIVGVEPFLRSLRA